MWPVVLILLGFIAGLGTGYKYVHKKIVPLVRFVSRADKERVLKEHDIHFDESTKCSVCGDVITIENIGAVIPSESGNTFLCSKPQCMIVSDIWTLKEGAASSF